MAKDKFSVWSEAYAAALQGCAAKYGAVENQVDYERLRNFCDKAASDAANAFSRWAGKTLS